VLDMPIFLDALIGGLVTAAGSIVGRVLIALGIGYVTYSGVDTALGVLKTAIWSNMSATGATVLGIMATLQVDTAINIIFSALTARLVLNGLTSGAITRMVIK